MVNPTQKAEAEDLQVLFEVECPALKENVVLYKRVWYLHIINKRTGHPYMDGKDDLVKKAVESVTSIEQLLRFSQYPKNEWYTDYACPHFRPLSDFLRVAFRRTEEGIVMISSAYHTGVVRYEP